MANSFILPQIGFVTTARARLVLLLCLVVAASLVAAGASRFWKNPPQPNVWLQFTSEAFDAIRQNYWDKISEADLAEIFRRGAEKLLDHPQTLETKDRAGLEKMLARDLRDLKTDQKKEFVLNLTNLVLVNLKPFGRSQLYGQKQETQLRETVENIDRSADLYQSLGVKKDATPEQIQKAYEQKIAELAPQKETSSAAVQELAQAERAYETLGQKGSREIYDQTQVESTVFARSLTKDITLIRLTKLSPQTFNEFQKTAADLDKKSSATSLILDLRGNVGGAIDLLQYFLGPFIGPNQYAYEFFHQGELKPFKTLSGWLGSLVRYKEVVILVDGQTQSSAELLASVLKKYNVGILVGTKTRGWGTVENTFPLKTSLDPSEKYSLFLVHSLALADDNQPVEGRGVEPLVNISDPNWPSQLYNYLHYPELVSAVKTLVENK